MSIASGKGSSDLVVQSNLFKHSRHSFVRSSNLAEFLSHQSISGQAHSTVRLSAQAHTNIRFTWSGSSYCKGKTADICS